MMSNSHHPDEFEDLRDLLAASGVTGAQVAEVLAAKADVARFEARRRRRRTLVGVGVAAAIAAVLIALPVLMPSEHSAAIALGRAEPLQFPITAGPGLEAFPAPQYELDGDLRIARYENAAGVMTIAVGDEDSWEVPEGAESTTVGDDPGRLFTSNGIARLVWSHDGDWIGVSGRGPYAKPAALLKVATGITDDDTPVELPLELSPVGWELTAYKSDRMLAFTGPGRLELTVTFGDAAGGGLETDYGASGIQPVQQAGVEGSLGTAPDGGWILAGTSATQKRFTLQAPAAMSRLHVIELAASVR